MKATDAKLIEFLKALENPEEGHGPVVGLTDRPKRQTIGPLALR